ncbi:MAG: PilZ domain-containing protein [Nitrospinota bacterium]
MFYVGQPLTLDYKGKTHKSSLRGWKMRKDSYLMVDPPALSESRLLTESTVDVVVRLENEGTVYGFVADSAMLLAKTNLMILKLKEETMEHSVRSDTRYQCFIPVDISSAAGDGEKPEGKGMICDISMNGVRLLAKNPVRDEGSIKLTFSLGDDLTIRRSRLKVMRSKMVINKYMYGGIFLGMGNEDKDKLKRFFDFFKEWKLQE